MGKTAEEAREIARNMATMAEMTTGFGQQPSDAAGRILMQPEFLMERQRRVEARRDAQAPLPEIEFAPGEVVTVEDAPAQSVAPAPKVGEVGFEFVDESDPSGTRYRRTEDGFAVVKPDGSVGPTIFGPSTAGVALTLAERGQYDKLSDLQRRLDEERRRGGGGNGGGGGGTGDTGGGAPPTPLTDDELEALYGGAPQ